MTHMLQYPNLVEEMDPESIKYRFESCVEHQFHPVRPKQRTRSYGLRDVGWIPARDTMILSSNWQGHQTFNLANVGSSPTGITICPISSTDRIPAYEAEDVSSILTWDTIYSNSSTDRTAVF